MKCIPYWHWCITSWGFVLHLAAHHSDSPEVKSLTVGVIDFKYFSKFGSTTCCSTNVWTLTLCGRIGWIDPNWPRWLIQPLVFMPSWTSHVFLEPKRGKNIKWSQVHLECFPRHGWAEKKHVLTVCSSSVCSWVVRSAWKKKQMIHFLHQASLTDLRDNNTRLSCAKKWSGNSNLLVTEKHFSLSLLLFTQNGRCLDNILRN